MLMNQPLHKIRLHLEVEDEFGIFGIRTLFFHMRTKLVPVTDALKDDDLKHFVEAVVYARTIFLLEVLVVEICGNRREQLVLIAILQKFYDWTSYVSVIQDLGWLLAKVIDGEHGSFPQESQFFEILCHDQNLSGIVNRETDLEVVFKKFEMIQAVKVVDCTLQRIEQCGLAIAARTAHHHSELRNFLSKIICQRT